MTAKSIEIDSPELLDRAEKEAARSGQTLDELATQALERELARRSFQRLKGTTEVRLREMKPAIRVVGTCAATAIVAWVGFRAHMPALLEDWRHVHAPVSSSDVVDLHDRMYRSLIPWLPASGRVGYLQPADWPSPLAVQRFYLAEYALAPRLVALGTDAEFVIVTQEAMARGDGERASPPDKRLDGFLPVRSFESGIHIFRRIR
jgi:hypothetical protein